MRALIFISLLAICCRGYAGPNYQFGKISDITVTAAGVMVKMDSGLPDNCAGTPFGWMLIEQKYTALTSVVLAAWAAQRMNGGVYTIGRPNGAGYCLIDQFDPAN